MQRDRRLGRLWTDREPASYLEPFNLLHRNQMMENEPPEHTRLRRPVAAAFNRGHVERLRPRVQAIAATLLDAVDPAGFDVVEEYAEPLPVLVIAELLGVPTDLVPSLRDWSQAIVRMYEPAPSEAVVAAAVGGRRGLRGLRARRWSPSGGRGPGTTWSPTWPRARGGLSDDEIVASVVLLLNAGHEASVNVLGNGLVAMLRPRVVDPPTRGRRTPDGGGDAALRLGAAALRAHRDRAGRGRRRDGGSRGSGSRRCSARPTATPRCSPTRTRSSPTATPTRTSPSASGCTSASARRWRAWSWPSR